MIGIARTLSREANSGAARAATAATRVAAVRTHCCIVTSVADGLPTGKNLSTNQDQDRCLM